MSMNDPLPTERKRLSPRVIALAFIPLMAFLIIVYLGLNRTSQGPITIGSRVPDISMVTYDGEAIDTRDMQGKVIVVNFWAAWCRPCEQEAAELEEAWQFYKDGGEVVFLGLSYVDTENASLGYLEKFNITYPNGPDMRTTVSQMFRISGVPETYIIGRDGRLGYVKKGPFTSTAEIYTAINSLLQ
jgi:cytochrome c biogenesis protein CcmG, thiol:disulfide interchange protein DsbE